MRTTEKLQPWGCDQQGRYATRSNARYDKLASEEWRDTMPVDRKLDGPEYESYIPVTVGDWAMALAIVAAIAWIVSMGAWL